MLAVVGIVLLGLVFAAGVLVGFALRATAQSRDDEEDMSTGEISEETSSADSISNDTSSDDESSDDSFAPDSGDHRTGRPQTPLQPAQPTR